MDEKAVWAVLNGEREYQISRAPEWEHSDRGSLDSELLLMEEYLTRARKAYADNKGNEAMLDGMRKVVGMGIRVFENQSQLSASQKAPRNPDECFNNVCSLSNSIMRADPARINRCTTSPQSSLLYMEYHMSKAIKDVSCNNLPDHAMTRIYHIVVAGMLCFKLHGVPPRKPATE